jgi:hypothetical protein
MITYVINREDRPERLRDVREELARVGLNAHLFPAITNHRGWVGCRESHFAVMEKCINESVILILEDDVVFLGDKDVVNFALLTSFMQMPMPWSWDALYLGGSPQRIQESYSDNLYRAKNVKTSHAILWNNRVGGAVEYILSHKSEILKWDVFLALTIQPMFNCFLCRPLIATQRQYSYSDTCKRSDSSSIERNYNNFCK